LESFAQRAVASGTTLQGAVKDYSLVHDAWLKNPIEGLIYQSMRLGINPAQLIAQAHQALNGPQAGQVIAQMHHQAQMHHHERAIEAFESNLGRNLTRGERMDMAKLVQAGKANTLPQAPARECRAGGPCSPIVTRTM
jgi:hypothetical protein